MGKVMEQPRDLQINEVRIQTTSFTVSPRYRQGQYGNRGNLEDRGKQLQGLQ